MKAFFEQSTKNVAEQLNRVLFCSDRKYPYPAHFHSNLEMLCVRKGPYAVAINGETFYIDSGEIVIFDQYDIHEYLGKNTDSNEDRTLVIPQQYLISFNAKRGNKRIVSPIIKNKEACEKVIMIMDTFIAPDLNDEQIVAPAINLILSIILKELQFSDEVMFDANLLKNILSVIYNNYRNDITLASISKQLGYSQEHISRVFHKHSKLSIRDYINQLRIEYIREQQHLSDKSITELIFDAGFKNPSTYYRQQTKHSPGDFQFFELPKYVPPRENK